MLKALNVYFLFSFLFLCYNRHMKKNTFILFLVFLIAFVSSTSYLYKAFMDEPYIETTTTVCIDPGHGGYDSGAIGQDGTYEKDIALEIALRTGNFITKMDPTIKVIYTRQGDEVNWPSNESEDLYSRVQIGSQADYYIAFHLNSSEDTSKSGYCFYIKNDDMTSRKICQSINDNLKKLHYSSKEDIYTTVNYPLYVVDQLSIPSILFEIGYISNISECKKMETWPIQNMIAYATSQAIVKQIQKARQ